MYGYCQEKNTLRIKPLVLSQPTYFIVERGVEKTHTATQIIKGT